MKLLHTSDWHLGISLNNVSLLAEQRHMIEFLAQVIVMEKIDAVILAGDVFDHAVSRPEAIALYNEAVVSICQELSTPLLICAGNHDSAARLAACNTLLAKSDLYITGALHEAFVPIIIEETAFYLLPYFTLAEARYYLETKGHAPVDTIKNYSQAMDGILTEIKKTFPKGKKTILVAHCFVRDAIISESDTAARIGGSSMVEAMLFDDFDYVALGHLHMPQTVGSRLRYSGSPLKYSFGEANQIKSFTIIDTNPVPNLSKPTEKDSASRSSEGFHITTIPIEPLKNLRVMKDTFEHLLNYAQTDEHREDYLKLEITDDFAISRLELFKSYYPNLLSLTGKVLNDSGQQITLTVQEISELLPTDILKRFYEEVVGLPLDEELISLFEQAGESL